MFIQIDKGIYEKLSEAEKGVIQFLNQNEEKIPYMSITNIAEKPSHRSPLFPALFRNAAIRESPSCAMPSHSRSR